MEIGFRETSSRRDSGRMALSWRHHVLIQALLSRGPMTEEDFHAVFAGVSGKDPGLYANFTVKIRILSLDMLNLWPRLMQ